jgi:hypothetical protein
MYSTYTIASKDEKLVLIGLDDSLCGIRVPGNQILHVRISERSCDSKDAVNAVVEYQTTSTSNATSLVLVASFVVVGEAKCAAIAA